MSDHHDDAAGAAGPIDDEALDWAIRMAEPDADWDVFLAWLEGDATRAGRYDRAAAALQDAALAVAALPVVAAPRVVSVPAPRRTRPARWIGGAVAAVLAGAIGLGLWTRLPQPYAVETGAGEQRVVALGDGSSLVLAGGSKVRLDHRDTRSAAVERGEILFRVRHDAARPFAVRVGGLRLVDLGTVFDVKAASGRTDIAVAEGAVMVDPDGAAVRLGPGQGVVARGASLERYPVEAADVGGWREGRLAFDDAALSAVAADLSRQTGRRIVADPAVASRTFRGVLDARMLKDHPAQLGTLLGVTVREDAGGWTLEPPR